MAREAKKTPEINEREATVSVSRTILGQTEQSSEKIKIRPFVTPPASVSVKYGATIPTGDYASARVDVMITVPCYVEEIVDVYHQVRDMVDGMLDKEAARLTGEGEDGDS